MTALEWHVLPFNAGVSQIELSERWARFGEREKRGAYIVHEARSSQFLGPERSARPSRVGLQHENAKTAPCQNVGGH